MKKSSLLHSLTCGVLLWSGSALSSQAQIVIDFTTDVAALPNGFTTGWFSGGQFNTGVAGGWDAGDYDWQMGQVNVASTTSFTPAGFNFNDFGNVGGAWDSSANNIFFTRATSPVEATTSNTDLSVFALTMNVLAVDQIATITADLGASGGGSTNLQFYLNGSAIGGPTNVGAAAANINSSSFTLSQGDVLYFVVDSDGGEASDRRDYNFTVNGVAIPEPASAALLLGGASLLLYRRRR